MSLYAVVDIETTGTNSGFHSITEIAVILFDGKKVIETYQSLVNPKTLISPFISRLTGITNQMLSDAPPFHEVAKKIWTMTDGAIFVAHSVNFDYTFIREEFKSIGADFKRPKLCTVRTSRKIFPGFSSYSLGNICSSLGIPIQNRHRALGDAEATVRLLDLCLQNDKENYINKSLKKKSQESLLPPLLPNEVFASLPEKTGVYYFHDQKGKVIYVGKAINIKKRIVSHFSGKGSSGLAFVSSIANITYKICGTELIALLLESNEIKRLFPIYNQAQKFECNNYILSEYFDQQGIRHLVYAKFHKNIKTLARFRSFDAARESLRELVTEFKLCPKFCGMQSGSGPCYDHLQGICSGVCDGKEDSKVYNSRVQDAIGRINEKLQTRIIVDQGRAYDEKSVVLIENGIYKGFGYFPSHLEINSPEDAHDFIEPFKHNTDVDRILNQYSSQLRIEEEV